MYIAFILPVRTLACLSHSFFLFGLVWFCQIVSFCQTLTSTDNTCYTSSWYAKMLDSTSWMTMFVMSDMPRTLMPQWTATITSWATDIPTASAPKDLGIMKITEVNWYLTGIKANRDFAHFNAFARCCKKSATHCENTFQCIRNILQKKKTLVKTLQMSHSNSQISWFYTNIFHT